MAQQVKSITSEALEAAYRNLTPSQSGFTEDLMASNTIIPVLDLTASAGGTSTPAYLQNALAFGSQTTFEVEGTTTTLANTAGFWRVFGTMNQKSNGSARSGSLTLSDGLSTKEIFGFDSNGFAAGNDMQVTSFDFVVFLASGETLAATSSSSVLQFKGSVRQIADVNGEPINPSGFTPQ